MLGFEGMVLTVYLDQAGVPTTCGGHVILQEDAAWIADGITREDCERVLQQDVSRFTRAITRLVKVPISQPMVDALCSLAYNIGEGAFAKSSVLRHLNEGRYNDAADAFTLWKWVHVKQKDGSYARKPILLGRREAEARLFRSGILEVLGARESDPPDVAELMRIAQGTQFGLHDLLPYRPAIDLEEEPSEDELTEDGRLSCLPPKLEDCEPQAG